MVRRRLLTGIVALGAALVMAPAAHASAGKLPYRVGNAMGLVPHLGEQDPAAGSQVPAVYHGGDIMRGAEIHTIFWAPSGFRFHSGYETLIQRFFADSAADSGTTSNVYSSLTQFGDNHGSGDYGLTYNPATDSIDDSDPFPTTDNCASANGIPTCLTDHQVQAEVDNVIESHAGLQRGLHDIYIVLLPQDVDTCILGGICGTNAFGGYHGASDVGHGLTIYANIPDPTIEGTLPDDATFPNGNPDAEFAIDVLAHETVEAMTDPTGVGWMDPNGAEVADKCEFGPIHGPTLGEASNGADFNQVINGDQYLIQEMWSNDDGGCVQRTGATDSHLPLAQVTMGQFGQAVSGDTNAPGTDVEVDLVRAGEIVATATTTADGAGRWSTSLAPHAVGDDRDEVDVHYSGAGAPADDTILTGNGGDPNDEAGWTGWGDLDTGFFIPDDGSFVGIAPCFQVGVLTLRTGATSQPTAVCDTETDASFTDTAISPGDPVTLNSNDNRAFSPDNPLGALVSLTVPLGEPGGGFPACAADLEAGTDTCTGLVPGATYRLARSRGSQTHTATADDTGTASAGFTGSPALAGGDVVTLRNDAGRLLTALHVAHLRVDLAGAQTAVSGGTCEAGDYYGPFAVSPSTSDSAGGPGGPAGTGTICPAGGDATGLPTDTIAQTDDMSGGQTQTEVPSVLDTSPVQGETQHGAFTALAEAGLPGPDNSTTPVGDAVSLAIQPAAGGAPVFTASDVNTASGAKVPALHPGSYVATWVLTDDNGDTRTSATRFIEAAAVTGPRGPAGHPARVTCSRSKGSFRCVVHDKADAKAKHASVHAVLTRGTRVLALGHAAVRKGVARVTLRPLGGRRPKAGKARITLVLARRHHATLTVTQPVKVS